MKKYLKVRVCNDPAVTDDGVSGPRAERLWYEVLYPTANGYYCKLNSTPVVVDALEFVEITPDMVLEEVEQ